MKWLRVILCETRVQTFSVSFFIFTRTVHKSIPKTRRRERKDEPERKQWLCPKKQIPGHYPTRPRRRPLNQRRCSEGASIKRILKERFIYNALRRYFVPSSGVIDFLQVVSLQRSDHYAALSVVQVCDVLVILNPIKGCGGSHWAICLATVSPMWYCMWVSMLHWWICIMSVWQSTKDQVKLSWRNTNSGLKNKCVFCCSVPLGNIKR